MSDVFVTYGTIVSPLGIGETEHLDALQNNRSGVAQQIGSGFNGEDWYLGKMNLPAEERYAHLLQLALNDLGKKYPSEELADKRTLFVVSSTKADLTALPEDTFASTRTLIADITNNPNPVLVFSNACISGVLAINAAADHLRTGNFDRAVVIGIDALFDFVIYGFQSLFALSDAPCRPFDGDRKGISLGEACGIVILSTSQPKGFSVRHLGGASSNDANHISGPSRTGEGLVRAVERCMQRSGVDAASIDFISAHGTGTLYNDEMESIAFDRLGLSNVPVNSLKGYFGHTLGAAGVIESIVCLLSMEHRQLFKSPGFENQGTTHPMAVITENRTAAIQTVLKTASGFGGGNAALLLTQVP